MAETTFTFRVDEALGGSLHRSSEAHDGPGSTLRDFMRDYVEQAEHDAWFRAEVEQGLRELAEPNVELVPHRQVEAEWDAERADLLARIATANRKSKG